jgi:hypothetical protein
LGLLAIGAIHYWAIEKQRNKAVAGLVDNLNLERTVLDVEVDLDLKDIALLYPRKKELQRQLDLLNGDDTYLITEIVSRSDRLNLCAKLGFVYTEDDTKVVEDKLKTSLFDNAYTGKHKLMQIIENDLNDLKDSVDGKVRNMVLMLGWALSRTFFV